MLRLMLSNDRTEVDMDRLAEAFALSGDDLENRIRTGRIAYWFGLGGTDNDLPRMTFRSVDTGASVTLDETGAIISCV